MAYLHLLSDLGMNYTLNRPLFDGHWANRLSRTHTAASGRFAIGWSRVSRNGGSIHRLRVPISISERRLWRGLELSCAEYRGKHCAASECFIHF